MKRGVSKGEAEERAWRTVNKQNHGGKKSGGGRKHGLSSEQVGQAILEVGGSITVCKKE